MTVSQPVSDLARSALGFLSLADTEALGRNGILVPSPHTTLVSPDVAIDRGVVLWPGVILQIVDEGVLSIGGGTILYPGARVVADGGRIRIGAEVEIGEEGGFTIKASSGHEISIGRGARLLGGGSLTLSNVLGEGSQILGPIRAQNCRLADGASHRHPVPDERGAVLKGAGVARGITLARGQVIQSFGLFHETPIRRQSEFHPGAPKAES
ncbi:hypothetical protein [Microvirga antarctica]|uniref:hypothetical protein n=1 Tax=Microvirga antarctica TaxID=2819233 RepID=UPI001B307F06|nr:hypothetical protein [Microvirga antarctica]